MFTIMGNDRKSLLGASQIPACCLKRTRADESPPSFGAISIRLPFLDRGSQPAYAVSLYTRSIAIAVASPPPMQRDATPLLSPCRSRA